MTHKATTITMVYIINDWTSKHRSYTSFFSQTLKLFFNQSYNLWQKLWDICVISHNFERRGAPPPPPQFVGPTKIWCLVARRQHWNGWGEGGNACNKKWYKPYNTSECMWKLEIVPRYIVKECRPVKAVYISRAHWWKWYRFSESRSCDNINHWTLMSDFLFYIILSCSYFLNCLLTVYSFVH